MLAYKFGNLIGTALVAFTAWLGVGSQAIEFTGTIASRRLN